MIFPSNWFGDLEERGVQQHAVAAVLCVGAEMFLVFGAVLEAHHHHHLL